VTTCSHLKIACLNPFELIRKYQCAACGEIMMCACDEELGRRFLPHQLREAVVLDTQQRLPVTLGFQQGICNRCRGLPEEAHPVAQIYGRTSKIARYYWREIAFEKMRRFEAWAQAHGLGDVTPLETEHRAVSAAIEKEVMQDIRSLHERSPKYQFKEESQGETIAKNHVEVVNLRAAYVKHEGRKALVLDGETPSSVEELVSRQYEREGYSVLKTESVPFHAIFGVFLCLLIEDPFDPKGRMVFFGERGAAEERREGEQIWISLPEDFGTPSYARRRSGAIDEHFASMLKGDTRELLWAFDYWKTSHSKRLREYLWAHRVEDVRVAREIVCIIGADTVRLILRYLLAHYWKRFCGWPDLLVHRKSDYFFAEVKSSGDELSEDQKTWIRGNHNELRLPFKLVKVHRAGTVNSSRRLS
jgi:hypothetical protein